jgi:hypothetical protein
MSENLPVGEDETEARSTSDETDSEDESTQDSDESSSFEWTEPKRRVRWFCQLCKNSIFGQPKLWFSAEAINPYGCGTGWLTSGGFRSWETIQSRPGFLRYYFCASECLRKYAYQDRQDSDSDLEIQTS